MLVTPIILELDMCRIGLEFLDWVLIATTENPPLEITTSYKSICYEGLARGDFLIQLLF